MEKRSSQCKLGQPMEQTSGLFCTYDSGVARGQSQHQCHFWRVNSIFRSILRGQVSLAAVNQIHVFHEAMNGLKKI